MDSLDLYSASFESMQQELAHIDKEQKRIDREALILEKRLRKLMETGLMNFVF